MAAPKSVFARLGKRQEMVGAAYFTPLLAPAFAKRTLGSQSRTRLGA